MYPRTNLRNMWYTVIVVLSACNWTLGHKASRESCGKGSASPLKNNKNRLVLLSVRAILTNGSFLGCCQYGCGPAPRHPSNLAAVCASIIIPHYPHPNPDPYPIPNPIRKPRPNPNPKSYLISSYLTNKHHTFNSTAIFTTNGKWCAYSLGAFLGSVESAELSWSADLFWPPVIGWAASRDTTGSAV